MSRFVVVALFAQVVPVEPFWARGIFWRPKIFFYLIPVNGQFKTLLLSWSQRNLARGHQENFDSPYPWLASTRLVGVGRL